MAESTGKRKRKRAAEAAPVPLFAYAAGEAAMPLVGRIHVERLAADLGTGEGARPGAARLAGPAGLRARGRAPSAPRRRRHTVDHRQLDLFG